MHLTLQWSTYAYKDKLKEQKRLAEQQPEVVAQRSSAKNQARIARAEKKKHNASWSSQVEQRKERDKRREKKTKKRLWVKEQQRSGPSGDQPESEDDEDDAADLAEEERMAKKVRKGQITQDHFDAAFGEL